MKTCSNHPNTKVYAKGYCRSCYEKNLRKLNPKFAQRQRNNRKKWAENPKNKKRIKYLNKRATKRWKKQPFEVKRSRFLKNRYGITLEDYDKLFKCQNGLCAICRRPADNKSLHIDHNHETKRVRGLLCFRCNYGLSWFQENVLRFKCAAKYLENTTHDLFVC